MASKHPHGKGRLAAIVGPTGVGKSRLGVRLAQAFDGEIVNADSRQIYRHMDVGTAKPGAEEMHLVPHHLFGIVSPDEDFSLAHYQKATSAIISDILRRGKLPILVGGSGMYVWSVLEGWQIPHVPPDPELRQRLEERARREGVAALYQELAGVDPVAARRINPGNVRRIIRALEVHHKTGVKISELQAKQPPPFESLITGLTMPRDELYQRIDQRVDEMIGQGLVAEVEKLLGMGYTSNLPAMSGIGYRQIVSYLEGKTILAEAIQQIKYENHRFVRHQYSWFRPGDERIRWLDAKADPEPEATKLVTAFLGKEQS